LTRSGSVAIIICTIVTASTNVTFERGRSDAGARPGPRAGVGRAPGAPPVDFPIPETPGAGPWR
jgi:hypothetical protein